MKNLLAASALALAISTSVVQANTISGSLWHVPEATANAASLANVPATTPDVTFSVNSPFNFDASGATVSTWLASSGAFNITENTLGTLASLMDNGSQGTLVYFTGFVTVTNGQSFTVTHDDGLTLVIGGVDLGFPDGPTAPVQDTLTYSGVSGNLPFQLVYAECCGGPAVLQVSLPFRDTVNDTPLPGALPLFVGGIGALGALTWRRRSGAKSIA
jgi:hypothetical protein